MHRRLENWLFGWVAIASGLARVASLGLWSPAWMLSFSRYLSIRRIRRLRILELSPLKLD